MRYENLHPFITVTDCTFEMKVKKYRPNPNPRTHTATPGARLEEPINVGNCQAADKIMDADKRTAG